MYDIAKYFSANARRLTAALAFDVQTDFDGEFQPAGITMSAHCNRVPVRDGHTECVSIRFQTPATPREAEP